MLIAPLPNPDPFRSIEYRGFSAVCFGYSIQPAVLNVVTNHQSHLMSLMPRHSHELGYRRPGLCIPAEMDDKAESNYLSSWLFTHWKQPDVESVPLLLLADGNDDSLNLPFKKWLGEYRPDVLIGLDYLGRKMRDLGLSIPDQRPSAPVISNPVTVR